MPALVAGTGTLPWKNFIGPDDHEMFPIADSCSFICDKITYSYLNYHELKAIAIYVKISASAIKA
jgi:hypothetical protein